MKFSVVIPTYNYARFISAALDSVISQSCPYWELWVIDDGSQDNTSDVLKPYLEQYPEKIFYYQQENCGPGAARNRGVSLSKGDYLVFLDADDRLEKNALDVFGKTLLEKPDAEVIFARHFSESESGKIRASKMIHFQPDRLENFKKFLNKKISISHGAFIAKRSIFENIHYAENIVGQEDLGVFAYMLVNCRYYAILDCVVTVKKHANSLRNRWDLQLQNEIKVANLIFDNLGIPEELKQLKYDYIYNLRFSVFRQLYVTKHYQKACEFYLKIIRDNPKKIFEWTYLRKFLKSWMRQKFL